MILDDLLLVPPTKDGVLTLNTTPANEVYAIGFNTEQMIGKIVVIHAWVENAWHRIQSPTPALTSLREEVRHCRVILTKGIFPVPSLNDDVDWPTLVLKKEGINESLRLSQEGLYRFCHKAELLRDEVFALSDRGIQPNLQGGVYFFAGEFILTFAQIEHHLRQLLENKHKSLLNRKDGDPDLYRDIGELEKLRNANRLPIDAVASADKFIELAKTTRAYRLVLAHGELVIVTVNPTDGSEKYERWAMVNKKVFVLLHLGREDEPKVISMKELCVKSRELRGLLTSLIDAH